MEEAPKLKDYFTENVVRATGERVRQAHRAFDLNTFVQDVMQPKDAPAFTTLSFTARSRRIAEGLDAHLGLKPAAALAVLTKTLPPQLAGDSDMLNEGFWLWPYGDFVQLFTTDDMEASLDFCHALTQRFTAEFAMRPLLAQSPAAVERLFIWATDESHHVRRLVSECSRPRLPWASRLHLPRELVWPLLEALNDDPALYVRRSVANHLNDWTKEDPEEVVERLAQWNQTKRPGTQWIVRHALRSLLKDGHPGALELFGYAPPQLDVSAMRAAPARVAIGETMTLAFTFRAKAKATQTLMIDIVMGYMKKNGSRSEKVFKYKEVTLSPGASATFTKTFAMVPRSTRPLYPGKHTVTLRVNGADLEQSTFMLGAPKD